MVGSFVEANAAKQSRIPREQLREAAQVQRTVRQYLVELAEQNPVEEPVHQQERVSTTDPDSTYATKGGTPARLGYYDNYLGSCTVSYTLLRVPVSNGHDLRLYRHSPRYFHVQYNLERLHLAAPRDDEPRQQPRQRVLVTNVLHGGLRADRCRAGENQY